MTPTSTNPGEHTREEFSEFENVHRDEEGLWRATRTYSGREACGETWNDIVLSALVIRVTENMSGHDLQFRRHLIRFRRGVGRARRTADRRA